MRKFVSLLFLFLLVLQTYGQSVPRLLKRADQLFESDQFLEAIEYYEKAAGIDKNNYYAKYQLGFCLLKSLKYEEAEKVFSQLSQSLDPTNQYRSQAMYRYATLLMTDGQFASADSLLARVVTLTSDEELLKLARKQKEGCQLALRQKQADRGFTISLMEELNSEYHDFGATINPGTGHVVFATARNLGGTQYVGSQFEGVLPDLTSFEWVRERWRNSGNNQRFSQINSEWSEGSGTFTADGNTFYFSSCKGDGGSDCSIMVTYLEDGRWTDPVPLNEYINEPGAESKQPFITPLGDTLFFSSDRSGGYGGSDIWMSLKGVEKEAWTPAINLGDAINTSENDITPYYSTAFSCLLFASNGHIGYGGYDLYAAKGESFFEPDIFNLGAPFNSSLDDTYFNISDSLGFLSSNRVDRQSLNLYSFDVKNERLFLSLLISGESLIDSRIISRFRDVKSLDLFAFRVEDYAGYELFEPEKRKKPKPSIVEAEEAKASGSQIEEGLQSLSVAGGSRAEQGIAGSGIILGKPASSVDYEHVYFAANSSALHPSVKRSIKDLAKQLDRRDIQSIEILSYTDQDGDADFNLELSKRRGKAIKDYMVSIGLPEDQILVRARGEGPLSERSSWYSKMFSRRAEIIVNGKRPIQLQQSRPFAVRYEAKIEKVEAWLGVQKGTLAKWNDFSSNVIEAGEIIRIADPTIIPNIRFFLEEKDLRNTFFIYKVKAGDTLASVASRYRTFEELLAEINAIDGELKVGEEIFIYQLQ